MNDPNEKTIRINGREISVNLSEAQIDMLYVLSNKIGKIVTPSELVNAFSAYYKNSYALGVFSNGGTTVYGWNCRIHICVIRKQIQPHGFDILSKRNTGYKLIDKVNPMNDPRDDFETIYATRHLHGDTESMKTLRNDAGSYDDEHMRDCYYIYLMAISKGENK